MYEFILSLILPELYYLSSNSAKMEAQLSPQLSNDCPFDQYIRDPEEVEMEQQGFCLVASGILDEALVRSLSVEKHVPDRLASPESPKYLTPADRREEWQQFMKYNFNVRVGMG